MKYGEIIELGTAQADVRGRNELGRCYSGQLRRLGTTLIVCEQTGRTCLMMEISPEYCDIIRERYEKLTEGKLPLEVVNDK